MSLTYHETGHWHTTGAHHMVMQEWQLPSRQAAPVQRKWISPGICRSIGANLETNWSANFLVCFMVNDADIGVLCLRATKPEWCTKCFRRFGFLLPSFANSFAAGVLFYQRTGSTKFERLSLPSNGLVGARLGRTRVVRAETVRQEGVLADGRSVKRMHQNNIIQTRDESNGGFYGCNTRSCNLDP